MKLDKETLKSYLPEYLEEHGINPNKPFNCINPEHADEHPSMSYYKEGKFVKCFSCSEKYDIFDCCKIFEGFTNLKDAFDFIEKKYSSSLPVKEKVYSKKQQHPNEETFSQFIMPYCKMSSFDAYERTDYFRKRGISKTVTEKFHLGFVDSCNKVGEFIAIPNGRDNYTLRFLTGNKKNRYIKIGSSELFNKTALKSSEPIIVTEGEFDALSIIEAGRQAVALGSTANWRLLCDVADTSMEFILSLDNDDKGVKAQKEIAYYFKEHNIPYREINLAGVYKDCNEALVNDRDNFIKGVQELEGVEQDKHNALSVCNYTETYTTVPTGFNKLDELLDGGLSNELYIFGGISSVGKTTFILQMCDQIAVSGKKVSFITMEMSPPQLVAKSISRLSGDSLTSNQILKNGIKATPSHIFDKYIPIGKNVYFYTSLDLERLEKDDSVIFVDYLQLLASGGKGTDKQNVDNVILSLKKLSMKRPVVVLSSLSRIGYNEPVSMEAFKESGNIEYTADVLIGMQFSGISSKNFDLQKAKKASRRKIELAILKNRHGSCGDIVNFEYYPKYNSFVEI